MRSLLAAAAVSMAGLLGSTASAQAGFEITIGFGQTYVSGRASCGCPIHTRRVCRGFDRYHRPLFDYHRQPFRCGCGGHGHDKAAKKYHKDQEKYYKEREKQARKHAKKHKK